MAAIPSFKTKIMRLVRLAWRTELASSLNAGESILSWVCATLTSISSSWPPVSSPLYSVPLRAQPRWSKMVICAHEIDQNMGALALEGGGGVLGAGACGTVGLFQRFPLHRGEMPMHTCMRRADAWFPTAVTHHGRVVLGRHIARPNLLRGGLLHTQAGLRVGRSHGAEDRSTSACVAPNTTDRALSDTTALVAAQQRLQHPTSVPASIPARANPGACEGNA